MPSNRINATFTAEQRAKAKAGLDLVLEALPFLIDLTPPERREMAKFGEKNRSFVLKALVIAEEHPNILPVSFNIAEFRADVELVDNLYSIHHLAQIAFSKIDDTYFAAGSEAYAASLLVYQYAKLHQVATGELEDAVDDLARRFVRRSQPSTPESPKA